MKTKTSELIDTALDWAVAISKGIPAEELYIQKWGSRLPPSIYRRNRDEDGNLDGTYTSGPDLLFSRKWEAGGPIIEREGINLTKFVEGEVDPEDVGSWCAAYDRDNFGYDEKACTASTPLIAAMRCLVAAKLGDEVEVPDELL